MMRQLGRATPRTVYDVLDTGQRDDIVTVAANVLFLSFKPLFALRMAFRECDVFFLGTARTHGGRSSRREEGKDGKVQVNGERNTPAPVSNEGRIVVARSGRAITVWNNWL